MNEEGIKHDDNKPDAGLLFEGFPDALLEVAKVATFGAEKYSRHNWKQVENGLDRYRAAKARHMLEGHRQQIDDDSGLLHAAHEAWNALAVLQLMLDDWDH